MRECPDPAPCANRSWHRATPAPWRWPANQGGHLSPSPLSVCVILSVLINNSGRDKPFPLPRHRIQRLRVAVATRGCSGMPGTQREWLGDVVCRAEILQPGPSLGTLGPVPHSAVVAAALPCPQRGLGAPWDTLVPCRGVEVQRPVEPHNSHSSLLSGMQFFPRQEKRVRTLIPGPALSWEWVGVPGCHLQTQHGDSDFFS